MVGHSRCPPGRLAWPGWLQQPRSSRAPAAGYPRRQRTPAARAAHHVLGAGEELAAHVGPLLAHGGQPRGHAAAAQGVLLQVPGAAAQAGVSGRARGCQPGRACARRAAGPRLLLGLLLVGAGRALRGLLTHGALLASGLVRPAKVAALRSVWPGPRQGWEGARVLAFAWVQGAQGVETRLLAFVEVPVRIGCAAGGLELERGGVGAPGAHEGPRWWGGRVVGRRALLADAGLAACSTGGQPDVVAMTRPRRDRCAS
jgi:hypothetical protein